MNCARRCRRPRKTERLLEEDSDTRELSGIDVTLPGTRPPRGSITRSRTCLTEPWEYFAGSGLPGRWAGH